jgi:hypothetical protein
MIASDFILSGYELLSLLTQSELKDVKYMCPHARAHTHTHTQRLFCVRFQTPDLTENTQKCDIFSVLLPTRAGHAAMKVLSKYDDIRFGSDSDHSGNSSLDKRKFYFVCCSLVRR